MNKNASPLFLYLRRSIFYMTIHKEGYRTIAYATLIFGVLSTVCFVFLSAPFPMLTACIFAISLLVLLILISFFRVPKRIHTQHDDQIIAPADGKVVVIEEIFDEEYFKDRRLQVSIFMSPFNVHLNRYPTNGKVKYTKYHPGKYLVAWHPKSSTENERHSVVIDHNGQEILVKQVAGALAKRIVNYAVAGDTVQQNAEMGFIKFGSRVDLLLPLHTKTLVTLNQKVLGGVTPLAVYA